MKKSGIFVLLILFVFCVNNLYAFGTKQPAGGTEKEAPEKPEKPKKPAKKGAETEEAVADVTPLDKVGDLIRAGRYEEAKTAYVQQNFPPNSADGMGRNPVHLAAEARNADLADFFVRLGNAADAPDSSGSTPLNITARYKDASTARILLFAGANIHHGGPDGITPAEVALRESSTVYLGSLITDASLISTDNQGRTLLHIASEEGNALAVQMICGSGSVMTRQRFINMRDSGGKTALDLAYAHHDSLAHARLSLSLVEAGANSSDPMNQYFAPAARSMNFNLRGSDGVSSLHFAVRTGRSGWTRLLLERQADVNIKNTAGTTPLHEAALTGDLETMRQLVNAGADVNGQDGQGNTAMHLAIPAAVHELALDLLLTSRANPNIRDARGDSPLHIVIRLRRPPAVVEVLLRGRADVSIHNIEGKTPLFTAVEEKAVEVIPLLLSNNADIFAATNTGSTPFERALSDYTPGVSAFGNYGGTGSASGTGVSGVSGGESGALTTLDALITERTVLQADNGGNTPLLVAVRRGAIVDTARKILDKNALVNARNQEGDTALHIAVRSNNSAVGELLLSRGADVFLQNAKGESPLYLTFYSDGGYRQWMFNQTVLNARDGTGSTILHYATQWKMDNAIPEIVAKGANIEAQNVTGETPLFVAVHADSGATVRALIGAGASLSGRDTLGNSALHAAVRWNAQSAADVLINAGIDVNAYNLYGMTPLHDAVRLGMSNIEAALLRAGANLELRDGEGNTALMEAVILGNLRSATNLARAGADINTRNNEGDTPLLIAVQNERSDLVGLLLDNGAQIHAQDAEGKSPFIVALKISRRMMLSLLEKSRDQTDDEGRSPLHIALLNNVPQADLEQIAAWVGRPGIVDREGRTPLRYAVNARNWQAARFLVDQGGNAFSVARDGKTPAELALSANDRDAVRALFGGRGAAARDSQGNTALHYAARLSQPDIVTFLLEMSVEKNARNTAGETAADIAARWGRTENANILR